MRLGGIDVLRDALSSLNAKTTRKKCEKKKSGFRGKEQKEGEISHCCDGQGTKIVCKTKNELSRARAGFVSAVVGQGLLLRGHRIERSISLSVSLSVGR